MKQLVLVLVSLFVFSGVIADEKPKKFEVKFIVKYNAMTLKEAAEKEGLFRKQFKGACTVNVKVKEKSGTAVILDGQWFFDGQSYRIEDCAADTMVINPATRIERHEPDSTYWVR